MIGDLSNLSRHHKHTLIFDVPQWESALAMRWSQGQPAQVKWSIRNRRRPGEEKERRWKMKREKAKAMKAGGHSYRE